MGKGYIGRCIGKWCMWKGCMKVGVGCMGKGA